MLLHPVELIGWLIQTHSNNVESKRQSAAILINFDFSPNQSSKYLSESLKTFFRIIPNHLYNFECGICLRFVAFHSAISTHIDVKPVYHHVCYGLGPTYTSLTIKSGISRQRPRDHVYCLHSEFGWMNTTRVSLFVCFITMSFLTYSSYRKVSNIRRTKSHNLNATRLIL